MLRVKIVELLYPQTAPHVHPCLVRKVKIDNESSRSWRFKAAHKRDELPRLHGEVDVRQHSRVRAGRVPEVQAAELDEAPQRRQHTPWGRSRRRVSPLFFHHEKGVLHIKY